MRVTSRQIKNAYSICFNKRRFRLVRLPEENPDTEEETVKRAPGQAESRVHDLNLDQMETLTVVDSPGMANAIPSPSILGENPSHKNNNQEFNVSVRYSQASRTYNAEGTLKINQYELLRKIGWGSYGEVFRVRDVKDKKVYVDWGYERR